jgi:hypothetical protein
VVGAGNDVATVACGVTTGTTLMSGAPVAVVGAGVATLVAVAGVAEPTTGPLGSSFAHPASTAHAAIQRSV